MWTAADATPIPLRVTINDSNSRRTMDAALITQLYAGGGSRSYLRLAARFEDPELSESKALISGGYLGSLLY